MSTKPPTAESAGPIQYHKDEEFIYRYANNVQIEATSWDIKINFGQTETQLGPNTVIQHTAITLPWPYLKIFSYLLQTQLAAREAEEGRILVPRNIVREPLTEVPKELADKLKHPKEGIAAVRELWEKFVAANPELKP
jgi:hypothetical protein